MGKTFNEHSMVAKVIMGIVEELIDELCVDYDISFFEPGHDIARRFLNEIVEFKPLEENKDVDAAHGDHGDIKEY